MKKIVVQHSLVGDDPLSVPAKNKRRGSSFTARTFEQLKNLVEALRRCSERDIALELRKAEMLLEEKRFSDKQRKVAYNDLSKLRKGQR